jgi:hypothetical protein
LEVNKLAATTKNIIVGAAKVFVTKGSNVTNGALDFTAAPWTTAFDAKTAMADTAVTAIYNEVGYTDNGVEVAYEPSFGDVTVDQLLDSALIFKQSMKVTVNTTLSEATLENLLIVWGQNDNTLDGAHGDDEQTLDIVPGELGDYPFERGLVFIGPAPRRASAGAQDKQYDRIYNVTRAIQDQNSNHSLKRSEATTFPVSFRLLPDDTQANNRYGRVRDRVRKTRP